LKTTAIEDHCNTADQKARANANCELHVVAGHEPGSDERTGERSECLSQQRKNEVHRRKQLHALAVASMVETSVPLWYDRGMSNARIHIRKAVSRDLPDLGRLSVELARLHASFDAERFAVSELTEPVFEAFFAKQLNRRDAVLLVAEQDGTVVGYAFVRMESASLEELRGPGAWIHDLYVEPAVRGMSIGRLLVQAAIDAARGLGSDSLMLSVSPWNKPAQRLFEATGLRATMVEMRIELKSEDGASSSLPVRPT